MKKVLLLCMLILTMSCSTDDSTTQRAASEKSYSLVYTTQELPASTTVYAGTEVTYVEGFEFIVSEYDNVTNTVTVDTEVGPTKIESNFYIENGSEVSIILYDNEGNVIDERTISQIDYTYIYEF